MVFKDLYILLENLN